jgi:hypothetical protein
MNGLKIAALRGLRTTIQALAGVAVAVPAVSSISDAKTAGVAAFLQNYAETLPE